MVDLFSPMNGLFFGSAFCSLLPSYVWLRGMRGARFLVAWFFASERGGDRGEKGGRERSRKKEENREE